LRRLGFFSKVPNRFAEKARCAVRAVHAWVTDRHRSREFIEFLEPMPAYPAHRAIKLILDNHSHISKGDQSLVAHQPARFEFTFTAKHGSWLNLVTALFPSSPAPSSATSKRNQRSHQSPLILQTQSNRLI
jgi:hypothetical protein